MSETSWLAMLASESAGLSEVRPKVILGDFARPGSSTEWLSLLPPPVYPGSTTLIEIVLLIRIARSAKAQRILEFGTYLGGTTAQLARNLPGALIYSIDLPQPPLSQPGVPGDADVRAGDDSSLRNYYLSHGPEMLRSLTEVEGRRVSCIQIDSRLMSVADQGWTDSFDLVFIDGGHDLHTVASDTANAALALKNTGLVVWHDADSKFYPSVRRVVEVVALKQPVLRIAGTSLAVSRMPNDQQWLFAELARLEPDEDDA